MIPRARVAPPRKGSILGDGAAHLAASCSARGQVGPLPMRGSANLAPPAPPAKRSEPIASQILHLGPPTSEAKIGPAGTSGTGPALEIGYRALMGRWISLTSAWLGAAKAKVPRHKRRSAFRVRRGPICCRGVRSRVSTDACEKGRRRLRLHHRWGRARIRQASCAYQRVSSWAPRPHAAVWLLWAARSAVACPVCLWGGAAWHGGCALIPRWWSAPAAPSCRGSRFDSSCRVPAAGLAPPAAGIRPRAEDARRQPPPPSPPPPPPSPPPAPPPPKTPKTPPPSPPRPSPPTPPPRWHRPPPLPPTLPTPTPPPLP